MKWKSMFFVLFVILLTACAPEPAERDPNLTPTQTQDLQDMPAPENTGSSVPETKGTPTSKWTPTLTPRTTASPPSSPTSLPTIPSPPVSTFHLISPDEALPRGKIRDVMIDPKGVIWVVTEVGIYSPENGSWVALYEGTVENLLGIDGAQRVWAILEGGTAIAAYETSGEWTVYGPAEGWLAPSTPKYLSPGYGDGLVVDPQGRLWLASGLDDLRRFDPVSQTWDVFRATDIGFDPPKEAGYQGHFLSDVELSLNQKVWVGDCIGMGEALSGQGIRWSDGESWFDTPNTFGQCVFDIEIDPDGRMWVGGFDALMTYDPSSSQWSSIPLPTWERTQLISSIDLDDIGNPWVEILRYGGARAMLALCQHKEALKHLTFQYLPLEAPERPDRRKGLALDRLDRSEFLDAHMLIFDGPDQDKPWVKELYRYVQWH